MPAALRADPTHTTMLRRRFEGEMRKRFRAVKAAVRKLVADDDAFGLEPRKPFVILVERQAFRFLTDPEKLDAFRQHLQEQVDKHVLTVDGDGAPWTQKYVGSAYKQGAQRAYIDDVRHVLDKKQPGYEGTGAEFLRSAFGRPERLSKIQQLGTRAFEYLEDVTETMGRQLRTVLSEGMAHGEHPSVIARRMVKQIDTLEKTRALVIARTEIIAAHAEGQLDSFQDLAVPGLQIMAEWSTAGDDRVCDVCAPLEGQVFTVQEARGILPRHPNCRCAWVPSTDEPKNRAGTKAAIERSLGAERPRARPETARALSAWAGKEARVGPSSYGFSADSAEARRLLEQLEVTELLKVANSPWSHFPGRPYRSLRTLYKAVGAALQKKVDEATIYVRADALHARRILADQRFKTQFETGASRGLYDPEYRARVESDMFGVHQDIPAFERPVYGYLQKGAPESHGEASSYGSVAFEISDKVRTRSTVTMGDSLTCAERKLLSAPATQVGAHAAAYDDAQLLRAALDPRARLVEATTGEYAEVQIHGGVALQDVKKVWISKTMPRASRVELEIRLDSLNIPHDVMPR